MPLPEEEITQRTKAVVQHEGPRGGSERVQYQAWTALCEEVAAVVREPVTSQGVAGAGRGARGLALTRDRDNDPVGAPHSDGRTFRACRQSRARPCSWAFIWSGALVIPSEVQSPRGRLAVWTAVTGTVFIAAAAFWLSFTALADLARRSGIDESQGRGIIASEKYHQQRRLDIIHRSYQTIFRQH